MEQFRRLVRSVRDAATPITVVVVLFAVGGIAGGLVLDWSELAALGAGALICLLVCALFLLGRNAVDVAVHLPRNRIVVGDTASAAVHVQNHRSRTAPATRIEVPIGSALAEFTVPRLAPASRHEESFVIPTDRRGVYTLGPARSIHGDPLGVFAHEQPWGQAHELFVHPRTIRLDRVTAGLLRDLDGQPVPQLSNSDVAFHALRDYISGDDRRTVHWRSTARLGRLMVRQHEETRRWHLATALSTRPADYVASDEFELAVSVAGSLGLHAILHGRDLTVLTHDRGLRTHSRNTLLDQLAAVEITPGPGGIVSLAQDVATQAPTATIIALICGSEVDVATLKAAHARLPLGVLVFAVRVRPGQKPESRRLGDISVLTIGNLAELPRAMRGIKMAGAH